MRSFHHEPLRSLLGPVQASGRADGRALLVDGDIVTIDAETNRLDVDLSDDELAERANTWTAPPLKATRGTLYKYIKNVKTASEGCVTDE